MKNKITGDEPINQIFQPDKDGMIYTESNGLTIRQYYAGLAMHGILASQSPGYEKRALFNATTAVNSADALIAELNKE